MWFLLKGIALRGLCDFLLSNSWWVLNSIRLHFLRLGNRKYHKLLLKTFKQIKIGYKISWPDSCCRRKKDILMKSKQHSRIEINENSFGCTSTIYWKIFNICSCSKPFDQVFSLHRKSRCKAKNPHKSLEPGLLISACEKLSPAQDKLTLWVSTFHIFTSSPPLGSPLPVLSRQEMPLPHCSHRGLSSLLSPSTFHFESQIWLPLHYLSSLSSP